LLELARILGPLPEPEGGTNLAGALIHIRPLRPRRVIVISDGEPNDPEAALAAARALATHVASYFCGDENNFAAIAFLRALSWCSADGVGQARVADLRHPERLAAELRLLLTGPRS
jgi:hypothetical protein